jgi:hypothetical protein
MCVFPEPQTGNDYRQSTVALSQKSVRRQESHMHALQLLRSR